MRFVDNSEKDALWDLCTSFVQDLEISCEEDVYQSDRIAENALELVRKVGNIVGYCEGRHDE